MATRLKNLKIKRVALVDEGANPDAFIKFAKNRDGEAPTELTGEEAQNLLQKFAAFIAKAFTAKSATTFAEAETKQTYEQVMDREIYPMHYAFMDSVRSILSDTEKGDEAKTALLRRSLSEFVDAFDQRAESWAKGELTEVQLSKSDYSLETIRDHLNDLIAKQAGEPPPPAPAEGNQEPASANPDMKGENDMIFDTSKMTPQEKATFEDLAKRYGSEEQPQGQEGQTEPAAPATPPATPPAAPAQPEQTPPADPKPEDEDVYKGLHPAVKAELETLRKFREASEDRHFLEVAKKYELLGKKPEELAPVLKSLKTAGGTAYDDMIGLLDSNLKTVESSGVFDEIGKRGTGTQDGAWEKIEKAAQEIIKSKPDMRWPDAIDAACTAHPELLAEYEKSRA